MTGAKTQFCHILPYSDHRSWWQHSVNIAPGINIIIFIIIIIRYQTSDQYSLSRKVVKFEVQKQKKCDLFSRTKQESVKDMKAHTWEADKLQCRGYRIHHLHRLSLHKLRSTGQGRWMRPAVVGHNSMLCRCNIYTHTSPCTPRLLMCLEYIQLMPNPTKHNPKSKHIWV